MVRDCKQGIIHIEYTTLDGNKRATRADPVSDGVLFPFGGKLMDVSIHDACQSLDAAYVETFKEKSMHDAIVGDIRDNGLLWPLVIGENGGLIGRHRLKAVAALGWETVPAYVVPLERRDFRQM